MYKDFPLPNELPTRLDSSMLESLGHCPTKFLIQHQWKLEPKDRKGAGAAFGSVMHELLAAHCVTKAFEGRGLFAYDDMMKLAELSWPPNVEPDYRTPELAVSLMQKYLEYHNNKGGDRLKPLLINDLQTGENKPCVELSLSRNFTQPDFTYYGRCDLIAELGDELFVVDHKTTSMMGPTWANQWKPDLQLLGYYVMASEFLKQHGINKPLSGALVNGIKVTKSVESKGIVVEGINATSKDRPNTEFRRVPIYFTESEACEWKTEVKKLYSQLSHHVQQRSWPRNTKSCTLYGQCPCLDYCIAPPESRERRLQTCFTFDPWDPEHGRLSEKAEPK